MKVLVIRCNWCFAIWEEPGALVITPPDKAGGCTKIHVCVACYARVIHPGPRDANSDAHGPCKALQEEAERRKYLLGYEDGKAACKIEV